MPNPWKGYASVNDDVRHTYERVFYGRRTTGDLTESDVPGMAHQPGAKEAEAGAAPQAGGGVHGPTHDQDSSHEAREGLSKAWEHAEHAHGIRREMEHLEGRPYTHTDAPDIKPRGGIHGTEGGIHGPAGDIHGSAGSVHGPAVEPPKAPPAGPEPSAGNDMTPG